MKISKTLHLLFTSAFIAVLLVGCSKDKQLEKMLYKKDGTWNISSVSWEKVQQNNSGQTVKTGISTNAGTFTFDKDGSGSYNYTIDNTSYSKTFSWTVNNETFAITFVSQSFDLSGNITQISATYVGEEEDRNK